MSLAIISHPDCLLHDMGRGHPEQPARIQVIEDALFRAVFKNDLKKYLAPLATREQLALVHPPEYIDQIFSLAPRAGLTYLDPDTSMNPHSLQAALRSAGAAILGVDLVMRAEAEKAFCNIRPPGHHAERDRAMGFCFFNNVAVGVAHALKEYKLERVAIIDFDVHHCNGSEDIFKDEERVLLCSSFQYPFYPFEGAETQRDHILNLPLPAGTTGLQWRKAIEAKWLQAIQDFAPQALFFSAGFDGYIEDQLANFNLLPEDYAWLTKTVLEITQSAALGRAVSVLEGGYDLEGLGFCAEAHVGAMI